MPSKSGKIISVSSVKGGVGKTTLATCLAGIYSLKKYRVLIIDLDFYGGGIAASLDINNKKDVFMMIDSISNNRFTSLSDYVTPYNNYIDVLASPKDLRQATKIESKFIPIIFELAKKEYDVILIDTNHIFDEINLTILDNSYMSMFVITNDVVDLKNMKSLISIFKDIEKDNFITVLNNARDLGKDYMSIFDIRNIIKANVDYTIPKSFYIKNIDKYILKGEILTLNKSIVRFHSADIVNMKKIADVLLKKRKDEVSNND